jgi:hypothetical protein
MTGNRSLIVKFALAASVATLFGIAAPAAATETTGGSERMARTPIAAKSQVTRGFPAPARRDCRADCASVWYGRQFVLILGVSY